MQASLNYDGFDQTQPLFKTFQGITRSLVNTNNLQHQVKFQDLKLDSQPDYDNEPTKTNSFYKIDEKYEPIFSIPQTMAFQKKSPMIFSSVAHETFGSIKASPIRSDALQLQKAEKEKLMSQSIRKFQCDLFLMKLQAQQSNYKKKLKKLQQISQSYQNKQKKVNLLFDNMRQKLLGQYKILNNQSNKKSEEIRKRWVKRGSESYHNIDKVIKDLQLLIRKISVFPQSNISQDSIIFYKNFLLFLQFQAHEISANSDYLRNIITRKINKYFSQLASKSQQVPPTQVNQIN